MSEPANLERTRRTYDTVADDYARLIPGLEAEAELDRAMLAAFAGRVTAAGAGPVLDAGCGPGRMTAHLAALGVDAFGVDLSPGMVAAARRLHPGLRFDVGSMASLDLPDGSVAGVLAWYSLIHTPPEALPADAPGRVCWPRGRDRAVPAPPGDRRRSPGCLKSVPWPIRCRPIRRPRTAVAAPATPAGTA